MSSPYDKPGERWSVHFQSESNQSKPLLPGTTMSQPPVARHMHVPAQVHAPIPASHAAPQFGLLVPSPVWASAPPPAHLMPIQFPVPPGATPRFFDPTNPSEPHDALDSRTGAQLPWVVDTPDKTETQKQRTYAERLCQVEELELLRTCLRYKETYRTMGTQGKWWVAVAAHMNLYRLKNDGGGDIQSQTIKRRIEVAMARREADKLESKASGGTPEYLELLDSFMAYVQQLDKPETVNAHASAQLDESLECARAERAKIEAQKEKEKMADAPRTLDLAVPNRREQPPMPRSSQPSQTSQQLRRSQPPALSPYQSPLHIQARPRSPFRIAPGSHPQTPIVITDNMITWPRPPPSSLPNLASKRSIAPVLHPRQLAPASSTQPATRHVAASQPGTLDRPREVSGSTQPDIEKSLPTKRPRVDSQMGLAQDSQLHSVVERWGPTMEAIQDLATELSGWRKEERERHNRSPQHANESRETERLQSTVDELDRQLKMERVVNDKLVASLADVRTTMDATKAELHDLSNKFAGLQKDNEARDKRIALLSDHVMKKRINCPE